MLRSLKFPSTINQLVQKNTINQLSSIHNAALPLNIKKNLLLQNKSDILPSFREWIQRGGVTDSKEAKLFISDLIYSFRYQKGNNFEFSKDVNLLYNDIKQINHPFNSSDFAGLLELCAMSSNQQLAQIILNHMSKLKLELTLRHYCALAKLFNKTKQAFRVVQLEEVLSQKGFSPNKQFYYQLMIAYGILGNSSQVIRVFHQLEIHTIEPHRNLFGEYLTGFYIALCKANDAQAMKFYFEKYLSNNPYVPLSVFVQLIKVHQKANQLNEAFEWFKMLHEAPFNHQPTDKVYSVLLYTHRDHPSLTQFIRELPPNTFYKAVNLISSDRTRDRLINLYEKEVEEVEIEAEEPIIQQAI